MHDFDMDLKNLSRIEGHATLKIKVRKDKVKDVKLVVGENRRFYEDAIKQKKFESVPQVVSRICGTCSVAHLTCAIEAIEKGLDINVSKQTEVLRKLSLFGTILRDHAMHLYFFVLPDILKKESVLDFDKSQHKLVHDAFDMKAAGNSVAKLVGGRAIHSLYPQVGGFAKIPNKKNIKKTIEKLKSVRNKTFKLLDILNDSEFSFKRDTNYIAIADKNYAFLEGSIIDSKKKEIPEKDIGKHFKEIVLPYSQSTGFEFKDKEYLVGALARMNVNKKNLHKKTRKDVKKYLKQFPSNDIHKNNLAQAIENIHCIDSSIELLEKNEFKKEKKPKIKPKNTTGVGVIEAPRGLLYYMLKLNSKGRIDSGRLVTPTAQNQIRMENDIKTLVEKNIDKSEEEIRRKVEILIRAYDPCMTCASRFLKLKWV